MKNYIGTKEIKAMPMSRGDYNALRGWKTPEDENPEDEGFLVEYLDSPNKNHPDYENYISWSPKDVFEKSYKSSDSFLDRLKIEADELEKKYFKLGEFLNNRNDNEIRSLGHTQFALLTLQHTAMSSYLLALSYRITDLSEE